MEEEKGGIQGQGVKKSLGEHMEFKEKRKGEVLDQLSKTEFIGHRQPAFFHGRIFTTPHPHRGDQDQYLLKT